MSPRRHRRGPVEMAHDRAGQAPNRPPQHGDGQLLQEGISGERLEARTPDERVGRVALDTMWSKSGGALTGEDAEARVGSLTQIGRIEGLEIGLPKGQDLLSVKGPAEIHVPVFLEALSQCRPVAQESGGVPQWPEVPFVERYGHTI